MPVFNFDEASPLDTQIVSQYPANERAHRGQVGGAFRAEHDMTGRHKIPIGTAAQRPTADLIDGMLFFNKESGVLERREAGAWIEDFGFFAPGDLKPAAYSPLTVDLLRWIPCDGRAVLTTTYNRLFTKIGGAYNIQGGGDPGAGNFRVPNLGTYYPVGFKSGDAQVGALGATVGAHSITLAKEQLPADVLGSLTTAVRATIAIGPGRHNDVYYAVSAQNSIPNAVGLDAGFAGFKITDVTKFVDLESEFHQHSVIWLGTGQSHENRPLSVVIGWLIKT